MRSRSDHWPLLALVALAAACLEPGAPWGRLRATLTIAFDPPAERLDDGLLKTARDYRIAIERIEVDVHRLALSSDADGAVFDLAEPPAGYSLCHNGHCHSDDGRLVPYEEIMGGEGGELIATLDGSEATVADEVAVALSGCAPEGCSIGAPTHLSALSLAVASIRIAGRAFDASESARLPAEGVAFEIGVPAVDLTAPIDASFGPTERLGLRVAATLGIPPHLFDDLDFAAPTGDWPELVRGRLGEHAAIAVATSRFD